jgi:hypothetical protein
MAKKSERIDIRVEPSTKKFLDQLKDEMEETKQEHVPTSEVARKIINTFELLHTSPGADLGSIATHAAEFQKYLNQNTD